MYQVKVFTGSGPYEVEYQVNEWLQSYQEERSIRISQVSQSDVVHFSQSSGIQRFTLVLLYEIL